MTIRTWVAWNKNRTLTFALPILYISVWACIFAIVCIFLRIVRCQQHWVFLISFFDNQLLTSASLCYSFQPILVPSTRILGATCCKVIQRYSSVGFSSSSIIQVRIDIMRNGMYWRNVCTQVMLILIAIPAWRICELFSTLVWPHSFSDALFRSLAK